MLVEARPIGTVISVHAPAAADKAMLLPHHATDRTDFQEVCDHMAGELPPPVEGFELLAYVI